MDISNLFEILLFILIFPVVIFIALFVGLITVYSVLDVEFNEYREKKKRLRK